MPQPVETTELTSREREILRLVRRGDRDREIASSLSLSLSDFQALLKQVSTKLEARDRLELAMLASRIDP